MSALPAWSNRRSDRVDPTQANADVNPPTPGGTAPEGMAPSRTASSPSERTRQRVSARRLEQLHRDLSQREQALLRSLSDFKFLSTAHLQRLHFADHRTEGAASRICRRVLARLSDHGVIRHLDRRVGGIRAGSAAYVWRVGPVGERLIRRALPAGSRPRLKEPSLRFLGHCLAVADCYVELVEAHRSGRVELLGYQAEPACWRTYLGAHGMTEVCKPDLYAVTASGEFEDSWFIEVDRGTESLPTLLKKCSQYERYRQTGREQAEHSVFPAVLWVVQDDSRARSLAAAIRRTHHLDNDLFRIAVAHDFMAVAAGGAA